MIARSIAGFDGVVLRAVERGHPLFGPACELIRAEALVPLRPLGSTASPLPNGLARARPARRPGLRDSPGIELLLFLGSVLTRCIDRWLIP
jgi:hypothetical protein